MEIKFGLSLTCSCEKKILKDEYVSHVIVNSFCLNQMIYKLFMNLFWNIFYDA